MINHARTLLVNIAGSANQRENTGEEYIPATFVPVVLPQYALTLRNVLFGSSPDRYFLNFRARELMHGLHQTELQEYVYALDPRVTYWPEPSAPFFENDTKISIEKTHGASNAQLVFTGRPAADNARGRCLREYTINVSGNTATIAATDTNVTELTVPLNVTSGISAAIQLPGTTLTVKIQQPASNDRWTVTTLAKPSPAVTTLLPAFELLGEPMFLSLFGATDVEPYSTFKNLWFDHPNPVYRLNGLVLALIYRTNETRNTANV